MASREFSGSGNRLEESWDISRENCQSKKEKKESVETTDGYCELGFCMYTLIWNIWNFEKRPKNLTQKRCRERVCERREGEKDVSEMKNVGKI